MLSVTLFLSPVLGSVAQAAVSLDCKSRGREFEPRHIMLLEIVLEIIFTVMILSFWTDMPRQTVQTQIRLLPEEQSDQGLHCLPFRLHRLDSLLYGRDIVQILE